MTEYRPLPSPNVAAEKGWKAQVDWVENSLPCFRRFSSPIVAEKYADRLRSEFLEPVVRQIPHSCNGDHSHD